MIRSVLTLAAAASLVAAPVAAHAAPERVAAPVADEHEEIRNSFIYPLAVVILLTLGVILLVDDTEDVSASP